MTTRKRFEPSRLRLARCVRAARTQLGLTQQTLGELAGLHRTFIGAVERGEVNISLDNIDRIALALAMDPSLLLTR